MKQLIIPLFAVLVLSMLSASDSYAQCSAKQYEQSVLIQMPSGFKHKHTFEFDQSKLDAKAEVEMSFILNKGTLYMLDVANFRGEKKNIIVELYNQRKELVAINYNENTKRFWPIGYACPESGVHYFKFRIVDTDKSCGIGVLGERR